MRFIAVDTETALFKPGEQAPLLTCVSVCAPGGDPALFNHREGVAAVEELLDDALAAADTDEPIILALQNGPYDWAVLMREAATLSFTRKVFDAHVQGCVWDTRNIEWNLDNTDGVLWLQRWPKSKTGWRRPPKNSGWYSLKRLAQKYLFIELEKDGGPRTEFGPLRGTPIEEWPEGFADYAMKDARVTADIALEQLRRAKADRRNVLVDCPAQARAYLALHLVSAWGLVTDLPMVAEYKRELEHSTEAMRKGLAQIVVKVDGVPTPLLSQVRGKKRPVKDEGKWKTSTKALRALIATAFEAQGLDVPMTEPSAKFPEGQVATDAETIEDCDDPSLAPWKEYKHAEKMLTTYVPQLEQGIVHPRYDFTTTGRSTSYDPNIQNLPRKGKVRECYVPREGFYYCSVDYSAQELVTFAQVMHWTIGHNALADALNAGLDPHMMLACEQFLGIDYDEGVRRRKAGDVAVKDMRQKSKLFNFGFPGGMGPERFVETARNNDPPEIFTVEEAKAAREAWFKQWNNDPRRYFRWVSSVLDSQDGAPWVQQFVSKRIRGGGRYGPGVGFTDGANGFFQGLAADMSKAALFETVRRCYTEPKSALFGSRVVAFIHDELLVEVPIVRAHDAAMETAAVMLEAAKKYCPDVQSKAEPCLMARWYKGAEYKVNDAGVLVPWEPEQ